MLFSSRAAVWSLSALTACLLPLATSAQVPQLINYQGRLLNGTNLVNGNVGLSLRLFNVASGGTAQYEDSNTVAVADGLYSTFIGDNSTGGNFLAALTNASLWVEVAVNNAALSPRERIASVAYARAVQGLHVGTNNSIALNPSAGTNVALGAHSVVGGGQGNRVEPESDVSVIGGGVGNVIRTSVFAATIGGGNNNTIQTNGNNATIGGGLGNSIQAGAHESTIGGGGGNSIEAGAFESTIGGGQGNSIRAGVADGTVGGGSGNVIQANLLAATIGGGLDNTIESFTDFATIAGGVNNIIARGALAAAIIGGAGSSIGTNAFYAVIAGGQGNVVGARATNAFVAGRQAVANHYGTFVWADSTAADFTSTGPNQFLIRASGGVGIGTASPTAPLTVEAATNGASDNTATFSAPAIGSWKSHIHYGTNGDWYIRSASSSGKVILQDTGGNVGIGTAFPTNKLHVVGTVQATAYITGSDRNAKENIAPVSADEILAKVSALPIATWTFKNDGTGTHLGPMAQDFRAAFNLGNTDSGIFTVDADGVALAAIQALAKQNADLRLSNDELKKQNEEILQRLRALEAK